ncbi:PiggyBac transposable element-derived protein 4 [Trichinella nativa]|uniref:PiggyBac transposable element-derived protein 4 n=2 Tax=Trichinella TaxID=6333 RepID=A0A0V1L981_9BILA|nr:PiggyBac transposable element-derived protein 4 [Trichinella nativa]KRZ51626.1 PiggyBac transposable element-derived protein 4 [Trichinella nativa]KRZ55911.1 PiggyBac transposable element-derived protein 4 [Trichinella nativa]
MAVFERNPIFDDEAESESSSSDDVDDAASDYLDQEERLIASDDSSEDEPPDAKRTKAAADQDRKFTCKSGRVWTTSVPSATQTRSHNIVRQMCAVFTTASGIQCPGDAIKLLITPAMVNVIVQNTNKKAEKVRREWNEKNPDAPKMWKPTDEEEIYAFIGLLLISGVFQSSDESVSDLWSLNNGRPIFRSVMTENRFKELLRFCRFDDNSTRAARIKCDKLAAFRDMWTMFQTNFKKMYKPSAFLTVDEQLVSTRARSSLKQYMPCKPGKYGIKIFWCCDAETSYPLAGDIYAGKQPGQTGRMNVVDLVKRLVRPWCGKGRNITMDNFFTSIPLAEDLLAKKTTIVGTLRRNKKEVPSELTEARGREVGSSLFCFDRQLTLVSYIPKRKKCVLLLSTMHHDDAVNEDQEGKPDIVLFYNETKSGVDTLDQLVRVYTCKRRTRRWPMVLWFSTLDCAGLAAYVIWTCKNPDWNARKSQRRRLFLMECGKNLVDIVLQKRAASPPQSLPYTVRKAIEQIGTATSTERSEASKEEKHIYRRCVFCGRKRDKKVKSTCISCRKPCCNEHLRSYCEHCDVNPSTSQ